ncbi:MAG: hypothetical protein IT306_19795 [Chloroflexi bacterium]|nr:hypothetical protein [Chloroflexota bacterium]
MRQHPSRRAFLQVAVAALAASSTLASAGCQAVSSAFVPSAPVLDDDEELPDPALTRQPPPPTSTPVPPPTEAPLTGPGGAPAMVARAEGLGRDPTPGPALTVVVPPTPTPPPPTPLPTATPRPRPTRAMLTVPYYSQLNIGRQNYCLPTSIAMIADRYGRLPSDVSGTPDRAPGFVADIGYRLARERIAALDSDGFKELWEEIGTDPLGGLIWNVFAANGRDLAVGMSPALAYLVLSFAFGLTPVLGTLEECLVALADDVPSILFGSYGPLKRVDGMPANAGGYVGDHAFVLVGIDYERALINDPLPSDKVRYAGERTRATASLRAVRFDLASVRRMTRGTDGEPRSDCFMMPPPGSGPSRP